MRIISAVLFFCLFIYLFIFPATNKHNLFAVNETTGVISLNGSLDREAVSNYRLRVLVSLSVVKGLPVLIRNNLIPTKRSWCHPLEAENNARLRSRKTAMWTHERNEIALSSF